MRDFRKNKNVNYYLAGAALAIVSTTFVVSFAVKKAQKGKAYAGLLLAGLAGYIISAAVTTEPVREVAKKLEVEDLLDDADTDLMEANISEILGNSADRGAAPRKLRQIEVDEEASIEDFE